MKHWQCGALQLEQGTSVLISVRLPFSTFFALKFCAMRARPSGHRARPSAASSFAEKFSRLLDDPSARAGAEPKQPWRSAGSSTKPPERQQRDGVQVSLHDIAVQWQVRGRAVGCVVWCTVCCVAAPLWCFGGAALLCGGCVGVSELSPACPWIVSGAGGVGGV